jgi:hypothetical protein
MQLSRCGSAILTLALAALPAWSADLTKIERTIAKEPAYQTQTPKYCLLVFGLEAKTKVWLVADGEVLYVDRKGNGDLTEPGNRHNRKSRFFQIDGINDANGKKRSIQIYLRSRADRARMDITLDGKRTWYVGSDDNDPLQFADRPQDAPIVHLEGPLTSRFYEDLPTFVPGYHAELNVSVGTPGLGKGSFASIECCTILTRKVAPIAQITFPHRDAGQEPIRLHAKLSND